LASPDIFANNSFERCHNFQMSIIRLNPIIRLVDESIVSAFECFVEELCLFGVTQPIYSREVFWSYLGGIARKQRNWDRARICYLVRAQLEFWETLTSQANPSLRQLLANSYERLKSLVEVKNPRSIVKPPSEGFLLSVLLKIQLGFSQRNSCFSLLIPTNPNGNALVSAVFQIPLK